MVERDKVKITEVAGIAGVSIATVSRVLNRKGGVSQKTRQQVERVMAELGYDRGSTQGIVGVIITSRLSGRQVPTGELLFQPEVVVRGTTGPHPRPAAAR